MGSGRGWLAGDWPSTVGVLNITAAAWTAGFLWWRSGNKKRMQNVSEYMLVYSLYASLILCCCSSIWSSVVEIYQHDGILGFFSLVTFLSLYMCRLVSSDLVVCSEVQMIFVWSSWCHCYPIICCSSEIQNGLSFWRQLTQVVLEKRPLNRL